jgi:hypothetical protein
MAELFETKKNCRRAPFYAGGARLQEGRDANDTPGGDSSR